MADDRLYRVTLRFDPEAERFTAGVPELRVEAGGDSRRDALAALETELEARFEHAAVEGEVLPAPADEPPPPLAVELTLAPTVARELGFQARRAGITVEALAAQLIAQGVGPAPARSSGRRASPPRPAETTEGSADEEAAAPRDSQPPRRGNKGRRRRQEGYRADIDDQANFLAYVRDMEKGGGRRRG